MTVGISEEYLAEPCLFVSSNTKDYGVKGTTNLHPDLLAAFTSAKLQYAVSLTHAESILTKGGWVP